MQYIPGSPSEKNAAFAQAARDEFLKVLELDPKNADAIRSIAQLYFNEKKPDEARDWYTKALNINPNDKTAHYTFGLIGWIQRIPISARASLPHSPVDVTYELSYD